MPETSLTNGYTNGHMPFDMEDGSDFLFTSESVGEGHPGKHLYQKKRKCRKKKCILLVTI